MKKSLFWLRGAREMLGLKPFSEAGELAYFDVLNDLNDAAVLDALRVWFRRCERFPLPMEVRALVLAGEVAV